MLVFVFMFVLVIMGMGVRMFFTLMIMFMLVFVGMLVIMQVLVLVVSFHGFPPKLSFIYIVHRLFIVNYQFIDNCVGPVSGVRFMDRNIGPLP